MTRWRIPGATARATRWERTVSSRTTKRARRSARRLPPLSPEQKQARRFFRGLKWSKHQLRAMEKRPPAPPFEPNRLNLFKAMSGPQGSNMPILTLAKLRRAVAKIKKANVAARYYYMPVHENSILARVLSDFFNQPAQVVFKAKRKADRPLARMLTKVLRHLLENPRAHLATIPSSTRSKPRRRASSAASRSRRGRTSEPHGKR